MAPSSGSTAKAAEGRDRLLQALESRSEFLIRQPHSQKDCLDKSPCTVRIFPAYVVAPKNMVAPPAAATQAFRNNLPIKHMQIYQIANQLEPSSDPGRVIIVVIKSTMLKDVSL